MNPERERPKATVVAIIKDSSNNEDYILLTQRNVAPYLGKWCLPGGHIHQNEQTIEAIKREVKEETGLNYVPVFYNYFDEIIPEEDIHAVVLLYEGTATGELIKSNSEVKDAKWVSLLDSLNYELAFQHKDVIKMYIKGKINKQNENAILHESKYLRDEILKRFETRNNMINYAIIVAGIILAFGKVEGYVLYPILGTVLAGLWSHSDLRIFDIGDYIKNRIEPNVPGLNWENYLFELYKTIRPKERRKQESYVSWVFITMYIIMLILSFVYIAPTISNSISSGNYNELFKSKDFIIVLIGIIVTLYCTYKTRKFIIKRRKNYT